jgi:hypothetical protein
MNRNYVPGYPLLEIYYCCKNDAGSGYNTLKVRQRADCATVASLFTSKITDNTHAYVNSGTKHTFYANAAALFTIPGSASNDCGDLVCTLLKPGCLLPLAGGENCSVDVNGKIACNRNVDAGYDETYCV